MEDSGRPAALHVNYEAPSLMSTAGQLIAQHSRVLTEKKLWGPVCRNVSQH